MTKLTNLTFEVSKNSQAVSFVNKAIGHLQSKSIAEWASKPHNFAIFTRIAEKAVSKAGADPEIFSAYIVASALGL